MHRRAFAAALSGVLANAFAPAAGQHADPSFRVANRTSEVVQEVYASPSTQPNWGQDRLGAEVIQPGADHIVRLPADGNCVYDLRFVYQGGRAEERRSLNTCNVTDVVLGAAGTQAAPFEPERRNPSFNLVNQSGRVIEQFYASPSSQTEWGPDRLGNDVVLPGSRFAVSLPLGGCHYDVRVVWRGGDAQERRNLNTCEVVDYEVR